MTLLDQRLRRVEQLIADRPDLFSRQATVVATWRTFGQRQLGPYYSLRYRDGRRQCSVYLGASVETADAVRGLLTTAQRARRNEIALDRMRTAVKASLRRHMRDMRGQLEQLDLTLKGFEVRGWRCLDAAERRRIMSLVNSIHHSSASLASHGASLTAGSNRSSASREADAL